MNGELARLSTLFRHLGDQLAEANGDASLLESVFTKFLEGRPDRTKIIETLAEVDPEGPQPELDEEEDPEGWEPIRLGALPEAEPFPYDLLPPPARELAKAAAQSIGCPIDFPAVATLAAASGLIGRSVILEIKPGYFTSVAVYIAIVGTPSTGKSPALGAALKPLREIGQRLHEEWQSEKAQWEATKEDNPQPPPELRRIVSTDTTTEALGPILAKNPRGLTIAPDEMTKWVLSMDQYRGGKGGDRPFFLSAWGGEPIQIDRAKHGREPIAVAHPFLTIIGGMTPDMLSTLSEGKGREDGFTARMLFSCPERKPRRNYSEAGIPSDIPQEWDRLANALFERGMSANEGGKPTPHIVVMSPEAKQAWKAWVEGHLAEQEADDFLRSLEGPWGKLEAYAPRLALILYLMSLADDPTTWSESPPPMPRQFIEDAARLIAYFKSHMRRVYALMGSKNLDGGEDVQALLKWIKRNSGTKFSIRDVERNFSRFKNEPGLLPEALAWMENHNLIRGHVEAPKPPRGGRKPSPSYDVNPALLNPPQN